MKIINIMEVITGNSGKGIRSDCQVSLKINTSGGRDITINSKVKALYGESINNLCNNVLDFYKIKHCNLVLNDAGALDFVIAARLEAAISKHTGSEKEFLPDLIKENVYTVARDNYRFSRLYLPGNNPKMMINAGIHRPCGVILDLEDSVAIDKKDEARFLVRNALRVVDFYGAERMVRINQGERGLDDLKYIIPHNVHTILIPKCEQAEYIQMVDEVVDGIKKANKIKNPIYYMPIIESALGIENAYRIAKSSENVVALAIGLEDFTADLGVSRTNEANESLYARTRLVNACKAAGIQVIDSVFSDVVDTEGLRESIRVSKSLGFEGMGCIHPRQIPLIHKGYAPEDKEIEKAKRIVLAFEEATEKGLGVVSLGTKMIDPPVVKRALRTIDLAVNIGIISKDWRENNG